MGRIVDWSELRHGDTFRITEDSLDPNSLSFYKGLYQVNHRTCGYYQLQDSVAFHTQRAYESHPNIQCRKQAVEIISDDEVTPLERIEVARFKVNHTTGSDPEMFVVRGRDHANLLPAFKFLPTQEEAVKNNPSPSPSTFYKPNVPAYSYRDGFAAECFINPCSCHGYFINYLRDGLKSILASARNFDRTAKLTIQNTFAIPQITMDEATETDVALGCQPSKNAYNNFPELPRDGREFRMRFAGGHVHLGISEEKNVDTEEAVKSIDIIAGIPAVAAFASIDNPIRRQFYGRAGEYRKPAHGIEYRTLSNAWLVSGPIAHIFLSLCRAGLKVGVNKLRPLFEIPEEKVQEIINFCDVKSARKFVLDRAEAYQILLQMDGTGRANGDAEKAFKQLIAGGVETLYPDYDDLEKNWKMNETWFGESNEQRETWSALCGRLKSSPIPMSR